MTDETDGFGNWQFHKNCLFPSYNTSKLSFSGTGGFDDSQKPGYLQFRELQVPIPETASFGPTFSTRIIKYTCIPKCNISLKHIPLKQQTKQKDSLSLQRQCIERAFGTLIARWGIFGDLREFLSNTGYS